MTMTAQDRKWLDKQGELTNHEEYVLDIIFGNLYETAKEHTVPAAGDDRAACLEAALVRFFIESREG